MEIIPQSICSHPDLGHLVDIPYWEILTRNSVYTSRTLSSPLIASHQTHLLYPELLFSSSRYLYSPHLSILWIFYGASILLIPMSFGYFMDLPEYYKRKGMWLSIIPTNSNFLSPHRLISFSSSPYLTNDKRTIC